MVLLNSFEIIGTIAFAISGALIGIEKKLDLFGIIFLAITTAVGGGVFRDLIIGNIPPASFVDPTPCIISIVTALVVFYFYDKISRFGKIITISDALGLGVFTAIGCRAALMHDANNVFIVIVTGLSTGVGGGIVRDVLVQNVPFVLKKEIYAMASIIGAMSFYVMHRYLPDFASMYICCAIIFVIRMLSIIYNVNLPVRKNHKN